MSEADTETTATTPAAATPQPRRPNARKRRDPVEEPEFTDWLTAKDDKDDYEIIKLNDNEEMPPSGQFFQVNGRFFILKAEIWHRVPSFLLGVIDHAVAEKPVIDDQLRLIGTRAQKRFTYEIFRG